MSNSENNTSDIIQELENLQKLLELGVITKAEFKAKKDEILSPYIIAAKPRTINKKLLLCICCFLVLIATFALLLSLPKLGFRCLVFGHKDLSTVITKAATCSEDGSIDTTCGICGKVISSEVLSKTNTHNYVNGKCTVCGEADPNWSNTTVVYKVRTLVEMHVRKGPGLSYDVTRNLPYNSTVSIYETKTADGYTWNRINQSEWIANDGTWLEYVN